MRAIMTIVIVCLAALTASARVYTEPPTGEWEPVEGMMLVNLHGFTWPKIKDHADRESKYAYAPMTGFDTWQFYYSLESTGVGLSEAFHILDWGITSRFLMGRKIEDGWQELDIYKLDTPIENTRKLYGFYYDAEYHGYFEDLIYTNRTNNFVFPEKRTPFILPIRSTYPQAVSISSIPEPSTFVLAGLMLIALSFLLRKRTAYDY